MRIGIGTGVRPVSSIPPAYPFPNEWIAYWDAGDLSQADGAAVPSWAAREGSYTITTVASPTMSKAGAFGGKPSVRFTATSSQYGTCHPLAGALGGDHVPSTIVMQIQDATVGVYGLLTCYQNANTSNRRFFFELTSDRRYQRGDGTTLLTTINAPVPDTTQHVLALVDNGTNATLYIDGVISSSGAQNVNVGTIGTMDTLQLCYHNGYAYNGWVRRFGVHSRALSATEVAFLSSSLSST